MSSSYVMALEKPGFRRGFIRANPPTMFMSLPFGSRPPPNAGAGASRGIVRAARSSYAACCCCR
eukprot:CAMPEP_0205937208 /NCGR_PEP_ID=MMETSP1325-20131115/43522_1 /ASSEMBLY_ACC=CAM_ASM_000708 /TAXON_ID=236786 /ORGANISM="Florenciella sp., Strain RCC1007" /LENGTH=63 /DNA_ID=CAMNT_0053307447 /DNA_START=16 /DNA_END=204 /DNA_ORIENTATION=+